MSLEKVCRSGFLTAMSPRLFFVYAFFFFVSVCDGSKELQSLFYITLILILGVMLPVDSLVLR